MKIIISGSGDTGTHLAKMLSFENQDVTLMSKDKTYLSSLDSNYNFMVGVGDSTSPEDLRSVEIQKADMFIAVTPDQNANIVSASLARYMGAAECVARVSRDEYMNPRFRDWFRSCGIGTAVYPEALVAREIINYLERNRVASWFELCDGQLVLAGIRIKSDSPAAGRMLKDIPEFRDNIHVSAIRRNRKVIIPGGNDMLRENDLAFLSFLPESAQKVSRLTGHRSNPIHNILIAGANAITFMLAEKLRSDYCLTVVDPAPAKCLDFSAQFPDVAVVNTSVKDIETMMDEGIDRMDLFVALDRDTDANMVACMMAREIGIRTTIAEIEDIEYIAQAERLGIDKVVNKKLITSAKILRQVLGSTLKVESLLALPDAEVAEIEVHDRSSILRAPVKDLKLPSDMTLGGLIRDGRGMLVKGDTRLQPGDRVMVLFMRGALKHVMKYFR